MNYYLQYWRNETWDGHHDRVLDHTASNGYRQDEPRPGDVVYVVTISKGTLYVGARLVVDKVLGLRAARKALRDPDIWPARWHVFAREAVPFRPDRALPVEAVRRIRLVKTGRGLKFDGPRTLYHQAVRDVHAITPGSAAAIDAALRIRAPADPRVAIESLLSSYSPPARRAVERFLAASIRSVSTWGPDRWVTTAKRQVIRFKVGWVEALALVPGGVRVLVDRDPRVPGARAGRRKYLRASGSIAVTVEASRLPTVLPRLRDAHERALRLAAVQRPQLSVRQAHQPAVVAMLHDARGSTLPQPDGWSPPQGVTAPALADEVEGRGPVFEGALSRITVNRYERDPRARDACLKRHGTDCSVCGLSFEERYGPAMRGFIHVHHLKPLAYIKRRYVVDGAKDLRPVCPNCHAFLHFGRPDGHLSVAEARRRFRARKR